VKAEGMNISATLWAAWFAFWILSARRRVRSTEEAPAKREPLVGRLVYLTAMVIGFGLLFSRLPMPYRALRLWAPSRLSLVLGLAVQVTGLAFAIWARRELGTNWAARVTIGARQELVMLGPYRIVRHPIYSGLLFAILGTVILSGSISAAIGFLLILLSVLMKLRREEPALRQHFGEAYANYARKVPGLVPGWPTA
jgi:protein-S-isoprenylcysteine O-methyltransferase Ste14